MKGSTFSSAKSRRIHAPHNMLFKPSPHEGSVDQTVLPARETCMFVHHTTRKACDGHQLECWMYSQVPSRYGCANDNAFRPGLQASNWNFALGMRNQELEKHKVTQDSLRVTQEPDPTASSPPAIFRTSPPPLPDVPQPLEAPHAHGRLSAYSRVVEDVGRPVVCVICRRRPN